MLADRYLPSLLLHGSTAYQIQPMQDTAPPATQVSWKMLAAKDRVGVGVDLAGVLERQAEVIRPSSPRPSLTQCLYLPSLPEAAVSWV